MTKRINPDLKDRLVVGLQMEDIVEQLNLAMKVRKLHLTIDYTDPYPKLLIEMPGAPIQGWMVLNTRNKFCALVWPGHPDLLAAVQDINERLRKFDSILALVPNRTKTGKLTCKLQVRVGGSRRYALTILEAVRGTKIRDDHFTLDKK